MTGGALSRELKLRLTFMEQASLFTGLTGAQRYELALAARDRQCRRQEVLFSEGQPGLELFVLGTGRVKLTQLTPDGREVILRLVGPAAVVGGLGLDGKDSYPATACALDTSHAIGWDRRILERHMERIPALQRNALRIASEGLLHLQQRYIELATQKVPQRLARALVRLADDVGRPSDGGVLIPMTQEDLAQLVGTTVFSVCRILSHWESERLLRTRREAVVLDDARCLLRVADEQPRLCPLTDAPLPPDCPMLVHGGICPDGREDAAPPDTSA